MVFVNKKSPLEVYAVYVVVAAYVELFNGEELFECMPELSPYRNNCNFVQLTSRTGFLQFFDHQEAIYRTMEDLVGIGLRSKKWIMNSSSSVLDLFRLASVQLIRILC